MSRSIFLPSKALLRTREAPTLKRRKGRPALMKRWKLVGCCGIGRAFLAVFSGFFVVSTNLYCSLNALSASDEEGGGGGGLPDIVFEY